MLKNSKSKEKATNNLLPSIPIQPPPPKQEDAYLDSIFTPDYKKIDEEISSFYSEFVAILDSINVPTPPKKPDPIINEPDLPIIPSKKAVLKTRPISALVPRKLPLLVSEKIRRAVSARQYDETTTSLPPKTIHTEEFDSKLLSRLSNYKDIVVFQPDDREVRFEDDVKITDITWRSPTRPQSAVSKVISRPVSAKKTSRPVSARYLDPISRPNSSRPLSSRPKSARPSSSRPVSSKKRLALLDFDFDDEYVEEYFKLI